MLINAPLVDQLNEPTSDGGPDESARSNCVPACLSSCLMAFHPGQQYNGDELRDAVYGEGNTGATDPAHYAGYLSAHGVALAQIDHPDGQSLVSAIVDALRRGEAATGGIPSMWGNDYAGQNMVAFAQSTHEVLWCDTDGATFLTAMNPWPVDGAHAFYQTESLGWWAQRIVYGRIFTLARIGATTVVDTSGLGPGFAAYVSEHNLTATHVTAGEVDTGNPAVPGEAFAAFADGTILYYSHAMGVRADRGPELVAELWAEIVALRAQVAKLEATPAPPSPVPPTPTGDPRTPQDQANALVVASLAHALGLPAPKA
jgi:hypothetical protein